MFLDLPDHKTLYGALPGRAPARDGRAFVGVSSPGMSCRLPCPARMRGPDNRPENRPESRPETCTLSPTAGDAPPATFRTASARR